MGKKETFIAGILILSAVILSFSLIVREKNSGLPSEDRIQAIEDKKPRSRQTTAGAMTAPEGEMGAPKGISPATSPAGGESDRRESGDCSPSLADEPDPAGSVVSKAPLSSAEFKAIVQEGGGEAPNRYNEQKTTREERELKQRVYREKLDAYREARREWKVLMDEAEERARATGDFREVRELRKQRPLPPRMEARAPDTRSN